MTRSIWKGPFVSSVLLKNTQKRDTQNIQPKKVYSRGSFIIPQFVGRKFNVHNGRTFIAIQVTEEMVGHKFGEFSFTRKKTIHKKKSKKKNTK